MSNETQKYHETRGFLGLFLSHCGGKATCRLGDPPQAENPAFAGFFPNIHLQKGAV